MAEIPKLTSQGAMVPPRKQSTFNFSTRPNQASEVTLTGLADTDLNLTIPKFGLAPKGEKDELSPRSVVHLKDVRNSTLQVKGSENTDTLHLGNEQNWDQPDFPNTQISVNMGRQTNHDNSFTDADNANDIIHVYPGFQGTLDVKHMNGQDKLWLLKDWSMQVVAPENSFRESDKILRFSNAAGGTVNIPAGLNRGLTVQTGNMRTEILPTR